MNGAAHLLRLVDTAARQSCSRIPHLKAHIHSRQFQPRTSSLQQPCRSKAPIGSIPTRTRQSSIASAADVSALGHLFDAQEEDGPSKTRTQQAVRSPDTGPSENEHALDAPATNIVGHVTRGISLNDIIEDGHPDRVLFALVSTEEGQHFVRTASNAAFERALTCLDPHHFVGRYLPIYRHLSASLHVATRFRVVRSLEDRCEVFRSCLTDTLRKRRDAVPDGVTLPVYRHVLRCAEVMGDERLARDTFDSDMRIDHVIPDLDCYSSLMATCARSYEFEAQQRKHNRQTSYHIRRKHHEPEGNPHNVLRRRYAERSSNVDLREYILKIFKELSERRMQGDERTFTAIMHGLGLVGDLPGVKSILRSVWNIDVGALLQHDEEEIESPTFYAEDSPLRPSQRLLETIVHVFGNNNEVMVGSVLCDYISRNYNIPISQRVWEQQFELTYQFAFRPVSWHLRNRLVDGNVLQEPLERVYGIMTDEPHNVQPSVAMLALLAMNATRWRNPTLTSKLFYLREAIRLLDVEKTELSELYDAFMTMAGRSGEQPPFSDEFLAKRQAFLALSLQADADLQIVSIAVRRLLATPLKGDIESSWAYFLRRLPDLIKEFDTFLPNAFQYRTPTGTIRIENGYLHRQHAIGLADDHFMSKAGLVRQAIDLDDHYSLAERIKALPDKLDQLFKSVCYMCGQTGHIGQDCSEADRLLAGHLRIVPKDSAAEEVVSLQHDEEEEVSFWEPQEMGEITILGSRANQHVPSHGNRQDRTSTLPRRGDGAHSSDPLRIEKRPNSSRPSVASIRPIVDELRVNVEHAIAHQEGEHLKAVQERWAEAIYQGTYAGTTPDPTARFAPVGGDNAAHHRPAAVTLGVWADHHRPSG